MYVRVCVCRSNHNPLIISQILSIIVKIYVRLTQILTGVCTYVCVCRSNHNPLIISQILSIIVKNLFATHSNFNGCMYVRVCGEVITIPL